MCGPYGQGHLDAAMAFVVLVVIVMCCPNVATAFLVAGLTFMFAACVMSGAMRSGYRPRENFGGVFEKLAGSVRRESVQQEAAYPGAIDTESEMGHRTARITDFVPEGNPYVSTRLAPDHGEVCVDDEANDEEIDGDERMNYQSRSRNDSTRATAGTMNRRKDLDRYLREEVEDEERRVGWGEHEE